LTSAVDRPEYALSLIMERSGAAAGYLYLRDRNGLRLAAGSSPHEPPPELETELRRLCEAGAWHAAFTAEGQTLIHLREARSPIEPTPVPLSASELPPEDEHEKTMLIPSAPPPAIARSYRVIVLSSTHREPPCIVGGVTLELAHNRDIKLERELLNAVAEALRDQSET
jgi:hypothetical protein